MPSQIQLYEELHLLSSRMAAAARAGDWEHLVELERAVMYLRDDLLATADEGDAATDLARKNSLIQHILDDDAEVRRHTEPWMERIRHFLGAERLHHRPQSRATDAGETAADGCGA